MKRKPKLSFLVTDEEFTQLKDGTSRLFKTKLTKQAVESLPRAIEVNPLTLVFPVQLCPKTVSFRTRKKDTCQRDILNIMAQKEENGDEILKIRLK